MKIGIPLLDTTTNGLYPGLIILAEDVGAGGKEFALTSLRNLDTDTYYISVTQSVDEVVRDLRLIFPKSSKEWIERLKIFSLSKEYFAKTIIPFSWISEESSLSMLKSEKILEKLVNIFDEVKSNSVIFIDSLTDLIRKTKVFGSDEIEWRDLIDFLIGLRKLALKNNLLIYILLTKGILDKSRAEEVFYTSDGVLIFEWVIDKDTLKRSMYILKLLGVLPILEKQKILRYDITIDPEQGFVISKLQRIV